MKYVLLGSSDFFLYFLSTVKYVKHRLRGTMHDFMGHLGLLAFDSGKDPFYVLAERSTDRAM